MRDTHSQFKTNKQTNKPNQSDILFSHITFHLHVKTQLVLLSDFKGAVFQTCQLAEQSAASRTLHCHLACQPRWKGPPLFPLSTSSCPTRFISPDHVATPRAARDVGEIWQIIDSNSVLWRGAPRCVDSKANT